MKKFKLLLYGFGTVGKGFINQLLSAPLDTIDCIGIIVKNPEKHIDKPFPIYSYHSKQEKELFEKADIIVECTNDFEAGIQIIESALIANKVIISASKKVLAEKLALWHNYLASYQGALLFEAAAAASIPIFRILNHHFFSENISKIQGILNGTSNYILSQMENHNLDYQEALHQAQNLGYAEIDPFLDVSGWDAAYKLILLTYMGYGQIVTLKDILIEGIQNIRYSDIFLAKECNWRIKLIANASLYEQSLVLQVIPQFVDTDSCFYFVEGANNGIFVNYTNAETQFYYGQGAGSKATGSAIFNDMNFYLNFNKGYQAPQLKISSSLTVHFDEFFYIALSHQDYSIIQYLKNFTKVIYQDVVNQSIIVKSTLKNLLKIKQEYKLPIQIIKIANEKNLHKILTRRQYANLLL